MPDGEWSLCRVLQQAYNCTVSYDELANNEKEAEINS